MKKAWIISLLLCGILLFSSCKAESVNVQAKQEANKINKLESYSISYEKGDNYEIYTDEEGTGYRYTVTDKDGQLLDEGYHGLRGSFQFQKTGDILKLDCGEGGPLHEERFYHIETGRVSRFFSFVLANKEDIVVYLKVAGDDEFLVVQNMFDSTQLYKELKLENISVATLLGQCNVEFFDNEQKLKFTYTNTKEETKTEILELN